MKLCRIALLCCAAALCGPTVAVAQNEPAAMPAPDPARFTIWAGGIFMFREDPGDQPLLFSGTTATPIFDASAFDFDIEPGGEAGFAWMLNDRWSFGARAFGIDGWDDNGAVFDPNGVGLIYANGPLGLFGGFPTDATIDYSSNLLSVEADIGLQAGDRLRLFAGPRYVRIDDNIHVLELTPGFFASNEQLTTNNLYGGQAGVSGMLPLGARFDLMASIAGGVYLNEVDSKLAFDSNFGGSAEDNVSDSDVAFSVDASADVRFRMSRHMLFSAGYEALWLDGVAEAYKQPSANNDPLTNTSDQIDSSSSILHHGPRARVIVSW